MCKHFFPRMGLFEGNVINVSKKKNCNSNEIKNDDGDEDSWNQDVFI